ncbi:hypothetical protein [Arthrobacter sp. C152]
MTSTMSRVRAPRWDDVKVGDRVELRRNGRTAFAGEVDARTDDGDIVWVTAPAGGRRLFHIADGFDLAGARHDGVPRGLPLLLRSRDGLKAADTTGTSQGGK